MSIPRQRSSKENGAKSKGPTSAAGKAKSCMNALTHGALARDLLLRGETPEDLALHMKGFFDQFHPTNPVELELVHEIGAAAWRLQRARAAETRMIDNSIDKFMETAPEDQRDLTGRIAGAFEATMASPTFIHFGRYMGRLNREFNRAFHNLIQLRRAPELQPPDLENEPNEPTLGNPDASGPQLVPPQAPPEPKEEPAEVKNEPTLQVPNAQEPAQPTTEASGQPAGRVLMLKILNGTRENPIILPKQ